MNVIVDGQPQDLPDGVSIAEALGILGEPPTLIIVELNGKFVSPESYGRVKLKAEDKLEVIRPAFGG